MPTTLRAGRRDAKCSYATVLRLGLAVPVAALLPGCLFFAEPPTSIKRLEPEPTIRFDGLEDGDLVHGVVELRAPLTSPLDVTEATIEIDFDQVDDLDDGELSFDWDTTEHDGVVELRARAVDDIGREVETSVTVIVDQIPTVAFADIVDGAELGGPNTVEVLADDDEKVTRVTFGVDDEDALYDLLAPYAFALTTCDYPSGTHTLTATSRDASEQIGTVEASVTFRQPLFVGVQHSDDYAVPYDQIGVMTSWDVGFQLLTVEVDGNDLDTVDEPGDETCTQGCDDRCTVQDVAWDTRSLAEGKHEIKATFEDAGGETVSDSLEVTVDHDVDGDGHAAIGYGTGDDCDDREALSHPGATEVCDGIDNDCEGGTDEDFDADDDGFAGDSSCASEWRTDCDDLDAAVNPAADEICGDGIDNDCAGFDPDCRLEGDGVLADSTTRFYGATTYDEIGLTLAGVGDVDGDGIPDWLAGSVWADEGAGDSGASGAVYLVSGAASGTLDHEDALALLDGNDSDSLFGNAAGPLGDVDGDGFDDFFVTQPVAGNGVVNVFRGPLTGTVTPSAAYGTFSASSADYFGWGASSGDFDDDGIVDLAVSRASNGTSQNAFVFFGPFGAGTDSTPEVQVNDEKVNQGTYIIDSAGDVDGDGTDDLILGSLTNASGGVEAGGAYILTEIASGTVSTADAVAFLEGTLANGHFGFSVAGAGDVDGDGYDDVLAGAPDAVSGAGRTYLFSGPLSGTKTTSAATATLTGGAGDLAGEAIAAGDIDGDGNSDVLSGSPYDDARSTDGGAAYLFYGPVSGTHPMATDADWKIECATAYAGMGFGLAVLGDFNEDGAQDFAMGAPGYGTTLQGGAWLFFGGTGY